MAQGTRWRLWPPTARRPLADGPQQGDAPQGPSAHPVPYPTHEGRALAPHLGLCTEPSAVRGSVLPPGPGLSAPLSSARDRLGQDGISGGTDGAAADPRWARVAGGEGCVHPPGPRRGSGACFTTWKGTAVPGVYEVSIGPPGALGVSRPPQEAPCKSVFSCRSGPQRGGTRRLPNSGRRAGGPESEQKLKGGCKAARQPEVPTNGYVLRARPFPCERRCRWDTLPLPCCYGKFPPEGSPPAAETQECPDPPGPGRRSQTGR